MKKDYFEFKFTSKPHLKDAYRDLIKKSEEANHPTSLHGFYYQALYRISPYPEISLSVLPFAIDKRGHDKSLALEKSHDSWKLFYDHCTLEELARNMKGEEIWLTAWSEEIEHTSNDELIDVIFKKPDTLDHPRALSRFKEILKALRYSPKDIQRASLSKAFGRTLGRKGGTHRPPDDMRLDDALDLMDKLAKRLKDKCKTVLEKRAKRDDKLDMTAYGILKRYFLKRDPRISELKYETVVSLLNSTTGGQLTEDIIYKYLNLTKKALKTRINPSEK